MARCGRAGGDTLTGGCRRRKLVIIVLIIRERVVGDSKILKVPVVPATGIFHMP